MEEKMEGGVLRYSPAPTVPPAAAGLPAGRGGEGQENRIKQEPEAPRPRLLLCLCQIFLRPASTAAMAAKKG